MERRAIDRRGAPVRRRTVVALLALVPAAAMMALPAAAALPGGAWQQICTGSGAQWIVLPADPARPVPPRRPEDHSNSLCAHAMCPREKRVAGRLRVLE